MRQNRRIFSLPPSYDSRLEAELQRIGFSLSQPRKLAEAVQKLSDHYTLSPEAASPWTEKWAQAASIAYYFPLNYARNLAVAREADRLGFFQGLNACIDFGSGMGSALHALSDTWISAEADRTSEEWKTRKRVAIDVSHEALRLSLNLSPWREALHETLVQDIRHDLSDTRSRLHSLPRNEGLLLSASYVLTELAEPPAWWMDAEALFILEPSTQDDARRLQAYREQLIAHGYKIWAPCTHEGPCPLLHQSARDWCHDRIHFEPPAWFAEMEKHLPMKNRTLTFSYLLARKSLTPNPDLHGLARLTGDMLEEKGKTRQSLCRGPEREFLAWFPQRMKKEELIQLERGNLVKLSENLEKRASELRLKSPQDIQELSSKDRLLNEGN